VSTNSKERFGYLTQKPETLLERIISASSNPGDIVLDPFMGGGTTLSAALKLNRQFIGIDIAKEACDLTAKRIGYTGKIINTLSTIPDFDIMKTFEFQDYVCNVMGALNTSQNAGKKGSGPDGGLDGKFIGDFKGWGLSVTVSKLDAREVKECIVDFMNNGYENGILVSRKPISKANEMVAQTTSKNLKFNKLELHYIGDLI